jgi:hypothetical protein
VLAQVAALLAVVLLLKVETLAVAGCDTETQFLLLVEVLTLS